jgi:hypothetical protein
MKCGYVLICGNEKQETYTPVNLWKELPKTEFQKVLLIH